MSWIIMFDRQDKQSFYYKNNELNKRINYLFSFFKIIMSDHFEFVDTTQATFHRYTSYRSNEVRKMGSVNGINRMTEDCRAENELRYHECCDVLEGMIFTCKDNNETRSVLSTDYFHPIINKRGSYFYLRAWDYTTWALPLKIAADCYEAAYRSSVACVPYSLAYSEFVYHEFDVMGEESIKARNLNLVNTRSILL